MDTNRSMFWMTKTCIKLPKVLFEARDLVGASATSYMNHFLTYVPKMEMKSVSDYFARKANDVNSQLNGTIFLPTRLLHKKIQLQVPSWEYTIILYDLFQPVADG